MATKFVVLTKRIGVTSASRVSRFFDSIKVRWWHYTTDTWLVVDKSESLNSKSIRFGLKQLFPSASIYVFKVEVDKNDWASFGDQKSFVWLHELWYEDIDSEG